MTSRAEFYRMTSAAIWRIMEELKGDPYAQEGVIAAARELAHTYASSNTKFDLERFLKDAGVS